MIPRRLSRKARRAIIDQAVAEAIPEAAEHTTNKLQRQLRKTRRATVTANGSYPGVVTVTFPDGATLEVPVMHMYTSSTFNGAGGPAQGHDVYLLYTSEGGAPIIMGYR